MANLGLTNNVYDGDLNTASSGGVAPQQLYSYLRSIGANGNEALFVTGSGASESNLNPNAVHDNGVGYGMFGHNGSRLMAMKDFAQRTGGNLSDWRTQAAFTLQELRSRPEGQAVANATSTDQLAHAQMYFERPQGFTAQDPTAGLNYLGRLNTLRKFTALDPNASGNFAPGSNPQITAGQYQSAMGMPGGAGGAAAPATGGSGPMAGNGQAAAGNTPDARSAAIYNSFANPGGSSAVIPPSLNAALAQVLAQSRQPSTPSTPLAADLLGTITRPASQAISGGLSSLLAGLSANGNPSPLGATGGPASAAAAQPSQPAAPSTGTPADVPLPPPRPADLTPSAPAAANPLASVAPISGQANGAPLFSSLSSLLASS